MRRWTRRCTFTSRALSKGGPAGDWLTFPPSSTVELRRHGRRARIEHFGNPVGEQIESQHGNADRHARKYAHPPRQLEKFLSAIEHLAPAWDCRIGQPEKAKAGLDQDRGAGVE